MNDSYICIHIDWGKIHINRMIMRSVIFKKYNGHCAYCGKKIHFDDLSIDHILALSKGGTDDEDNLIPCCVICNHQKDNMSVEEFRAYLENIEDTLDDYEPYRVARLHKRISIRKNKKPVVFYFEKVAEKLDNH